MDHPNLLSSSIPRFPPTSHMRSASRSPTRPRLTDDILADLSPTTTLEAFTSVSGTLRASIEAASPSQREFGVRAALASKKIHEWAAELSVWHWPANGSEGFENPIAKRRKLSHRTVEGSSNGNVPNTPSPKNVEEYWGGLPMHDVIKYETRIEEVSQDMDDLDVEAIKSQVLDTHVQSRTRPSSSQDQHSAPPAFLSYTRMDDFTTVITATVLQALPSLARLTKLMDIWSVRLAILRQVPLLMAAMDDAETVLNSAWTTIQTASSKTSSSERIATISQNDFEVIRDVLQDKVTILGRKLDQMLDTLESREDTLPEDWLDRMEAIEQDYGEWSVTAESKIREAAWAKEAAKRRQIEKVEKAGSAVSKQSHALHQSNPTDSLRPNNDMRTAETELLRATTGQRGRTLANLQDEPSMSRISSSPILQAQQWSPPAHEGSASLQPQLDGACFSVSPEPTRLATSNPSSQKVQEEEPTSRKEESKSSSTKTHDANKLVSSGRSFIDTMSTPQIQAPIPPFPLRSKSSNTKLSTSESVDYMQIYNNTLPPFDVPKYGHPLANSLRRAVEDKESRRSPSRSSSDRSDSIRAKETTKESRSPKISKVVDSGEISNKAETTKSGESLVIDAVPFSIEASQVQSTSKTPEKLTTEVADSIKTPQEGANHTVIEALKTAETSNAAEAYNTMEDVKVTRASDASETVKDIKASKNVRALPSNEETHLARDFLTTGPYEQVDAVNSPAPEVVDSPKVTQSAKTGEVSVMTVLPQTNEPLPVTISPVKPSTTFETVKKLVSKEVVQVPETEAPPKPSENVTQRSTERQKAPIIPEKADSRRIATESQRLSLNALISSSDIQGSASKDVTSVSTQAVPRPSHANLQLPLPPPGAVIPVSTDFLTPDNGTSKTAKGHTRGPSTASAISGYASSEPSPEIKEAEPTEYFRPVSPPIMGKIERPETPDVLTPTRATFVPLEPQSRKSSVATKDGSSPPKQILEGHSPTLDRVIRHSWTPSKTTKEEDPVRERPGSSLSESKFQGNISPAGSIGFPQNVTQQMERQRQLSISSDSPSISEILLESSTRTPVKASPQNSEIAYGMPSTDKKSLISLTDYDEESPSLGRMRAYDDIEKYSAPNSPLPDLHVMKRRPSELSTSTSFDADSLYPESPITPAEAPFLDNIDVSPTRGLSYPSRPSDDQLQQQISEILESIPATKIRLALEPSTSKPSGIPKLMKKISRSSLSPTSRSMSRAPSPSYTLAPAYAKNPRPRPQNGNPEIKLYHLSRSTGEAPIKLFVRLVGEHGERVMVRVGGGWADLGEYLKEYASHHGRRTDKDGKIEIQDLPPRNVSMGSNVSTIRNGGGDTSGRSSPISRPASSLERPLSSLAIRKTRKSVGEESRSPGFRSPSTPLPHAFRSSPSMPRQALETPPLGRSVSRSEWIEEESSLGLAGPKGRKVDISEKDAAWVESMKEKVRLASAEKEKKSLEGTFGEMDRVGGTKRLFKKSVP